MFRILSLQERPVEEHSNLSHSSANVHDSAEHLAKEIERPPESSTPRAV